MKKWFIVALLIFTPTLLIFIPTKASQVISQEELTATTIDIKEFPDYVTNPIQIVSIKYLDNEVKIGEPFQSSSDWLKGLSVRVKNVSDQNLKYVEVNLVFPRDKDYNPILAQVPLWKGHNYMNTLSTERPVDEWSLAPGEEVDLSLLESTFESSQWNIKEVNPPVSVFHTVQVEVWQVIYSPTHAWLHGSHLDRNPKDPGQWVVDKKEQARMIKMRQAQQLKKAMVRKVGYQPTHHVQAACLIWDTTSTLLTCTCANCFIYQDNTVKAPPGSTEGSVPECRMIYCRNAFNMTCSCLKTIVILPWEAICLG